MKKLIITLFILITAVNAQVTQAYRLISNFNNDQNVKIENHAILADGDYIYAAWLTEKYQRRYYHFRIYKQFRREF